MEIETDWEKSQSYNWLQSVAEADVAALFIKNIGKLECRPFYPGDTIVRVPRETWSDRMGYLAVEIDLNSEKAWISGFLDPEAIHSEKVCCKDWQSMEAFFLCIEQLQPVKPVKLSDWLLQAQNIELDWADTASLLQSVTIQPRFAFRDTPQEFVEKGKILRFYPDCDPLALLVGFRVISDEEMYIWVQTITINKQSYLPQNLTITVFDDSQMTMQANALECRDIRLEFSGVFDEIFHIVLSLNGQVIWRQTFVI